MIESRATVRILIGIAITCNAASPLWAQNAGGDTSGTDLGANVSAVDVPQDSNSQVEPIQDNGGDSTGTDPRAFTSKLMPYYRFTRLNNDIEVQEGSTM